MHASVLSWASAVLTAAEVQDRRVLEVGSFDVNGSVRPIVEALRPASYLGVDQTAGPGVDRVVSCVDLPGAFGPGAFDLVISTEMLEHVVDWQACVAAMVTVLAPGGHLMLTTRSPGFPYHPYPIDAWRFTVEGMGHILASAGMDVFAATPDTDPRSPGVFALAHKPGYWSAPWNHRPVGEVFGDVAGVQAVVAP